MRQTFRQWGMLMVAGSLGSVGAALLIAAATQANPGRLTDLAWGAALSLTAYLVFVRPCVIVGPDGVLIRNIVRDVRIPWSAVESARVGWELVVSTPGQDHSCWAVSGAPGPSRRTRPGPGVTSPEATGAARDSRASTVAALIEAGRDRVRGQEPWPGQAGRPVAPSEQAVAQVEVVWWAVIALIASALAVAATWLR